MTASRGSSRPAALGRPPVRQLRSALLVLPLLCCSPSYGPAS
ncbi:DUF1294 domain-containing protein, partial [Pseudomonas syringae]